MALRAFRPSIWRPSRLRRPAGATTRQSTWADSTHQTLRWQRARHAGRRWAIAGAAIGALLALIVDAPAAWRARRVERGSGGHVLLADAEGSVWRGSAVAVLSGGPDSRDARSLPGRLHWTLRPAGLDFLLSLEHSCCLNGQPQLRIRPGFGTMTTTLAPSPGWLARSP